MPASDMQSRIASAGGHKPGAQPDCGPAVAARGGQRAHYRTRGDLQPQGPSLSVALTWQYHAHDKICAMKSLTKHRACV